MNRGAHQLAGPSSVISDGSTTARMMVASSRIAAARPTPSCYMSIVLSVAKIENTATITTAALETTPAEPTMPSPTA